LITLTPKYSFKVPVDGGCITPDAFADKRLEEIAKLPVWEGNRRGVLGDLFDVEGESGADPEGVTIRLTGDFRRVRRVGAAMTSGEIAIEGSVGMNLGAEMKGGRITAVLDAGSWAGSAMKGGEIVIKGCVGDYAGAPYRGSNQGMSGGTIVVEKDAGNEVGCFMVGGLIRVKGNIGQFAGVHMKGGMIVVEGDAGDRVGADMTGGRIVLLGRIGTILPGFIIDEIRSSVRVGEERIQGPFYLFRGDITESWNGSLMVSVNSNPHLKFYKSLIV